MNRLLIVLSTGLALAGCRSEPAIEIGLEALLERHVEWRGGSSFTDHRSGRFVGSMLIAGYEGEIETSQRRDGFIHTTYDLGVTAGVQAVSPDDAWKINLSGQVEDMGEGEILANRRDIDLDFGAFFTGEATAEVSLIGAERKDGRNWAVVRIGFDDGDSYDLFLDPDSGALSWVRLGRDERASWRHYRDWRLVDGVRVAFTQESFAGAEGQDMTFAWREIDVDADLAEDMFTRPVRKDRVSIAGDDGSTGWIDFEFFREGRILFTGLVNGRKAVMMLDSGAEITVIDSAFAVEAGIVGQSELEVQGQGGAATVQLAGGVNIAVGKLELGGITVALYDLGEMIARLGRPMVVILGKEVFNETVVDVDFRAGRLAFHDPAGFSYSGDGERFDLFEEGNSRNMRIAIEGRQPAPFLFDTGAGYALNVHGDYTAREKLLDGRRSSTVLDGGVGGRVAQHIATLSRVAVGGTVLHDVPAGFAIADVGANRKADTAGVVGLGLLGRFHMTVDYSTDALYLASDERTAVSPFLKDRAGIQGELMADGMRVDFVNAGSPAEQAGWSKGEVIVAIDGRPVSADYWNGDLWRWHGRPAGTVVDVTMADGENRHLTLADYY